MKFKLTKLEKQWILYDVANSAFILLVATIVPIYFNYLAEVGGLTSVEYLAYWGYAASIATLCVAVLGPIFGTIADSKNLKKPIFLSFVLLGVLGVVMLGVTSSWLIFLIIFIIAKVGYSSANIFYDSMLSDITTEERADNVSSQGYAWGYIGSCIPFIISLVIVLNASGFGLTMNTAMTIAFAITALWWLLLTLPLLKNYKQTHFVEPEGNIVKESFKRLWDTLKNMKEDKKPFLFLIAFFFYIDGVYTIIDMATAYGSALGLETTGLLLALLVTQIVAFPCSIVFGILSKKYNSENLITVCIMAYTGIAIFAFFMTQQWQFWVLAVLVGMFQGGVQALSRSYFTKIIPKEKSGEYFGMLDICGKGASFIGTGLVGLLSQLTGNTNTGIGAIAVLFIIGLILFRKVCKMD